MNKYVWFLVTFHNLICWVIPTQAARVKLTKSNDLKLSGLNLENIYRNLNINEPRLYQSSENKNKNNFITKN